MSGLWTSCLHLNCIVFSHVAKTVFGDTNLLSFLSVFLSIHTEVCSVLIAYSVSPVGDMNWKLKLPGRISQVVETGQVDWVQENQGMMRSVENWGALFSLKGFKFELKQTKTLGKPHKACLQAVISPSTPVYVLWTKLWKNWVKKVAKIKKNTKPTGILKCAKEAEGRLQFPLSIP